MNRKDLYNGFNEVDDDILERSETASKSKKKPMWLKWGAIAACLCLVVSIAIPALHHKGGSGIQDPVHAIAALEYNGKFYETVDIPEVLEKYGLPSKIIAEETNTSKNYVIRAEHFSDGIDAAEEVLPGIKNDLLLGKYKPRETDVAAIAKAAPEERREKAEHLRVIQEKKPKADKESARSGTKRQQEVYATIGKSYEDMKDSKRVTEDSALVSLRYTARNMVETCDVLFTNFPGLLEKPDYKDQVIEIMQEPKQYILKLEGETDNEQH